jgi:hypothetical protein
MGKLRIAQSEVRLVEPEYTTDRPDLQSLRALIYEPLLKWNDGDVSRSSAIMADQRRWKILAS